MSKKLNKSSGAASSIILILGAVLLLVVVGVFIVIKINTSKTATPAPGANPEAAPAGPVYEQTLGDIKFTVVSARDLGSVLTPTTSYGQSITTTEKFIQVIIGAQNKGKVNTNQGAWSMGSIFDSDGREFVPDDRVYSYLPQPDTCGALMKPEFQPTPCTRIYEVSKASTGLYVQVNAVYPKTQKAFLDLNVQ